MPFPEIRLHKIQGALDDFRTVVLNTSEALHRREAGPKWVPRRGLI